MDDTQGVRQWSAGCPVTHPSLHPADRLTSRSQSISASGRARFPETRLDRSVWLVHCACRCYLYQTTLRVDGLLCILITDRDGVPVLKGFFPVSATTDKAPELAMRPNFLSTFAMATDQGGKLGLGKNKLVICSYSTYQVVQLNKLPLVVSFLGSITCNTGHILSLESHIEPLLGDLKTVVAES
uniref:Ragulator complex protein LAMTOR3 n=1 Tax=Timema shepardi TaxID=629360 RepID=A0A7R9APP6_TIMSH|nr:unnamed protein product [Timema shepardi]